MSGTSHAISGRLIHRGVRAVETPYGPFDVHVAQDLHDGRYSLAVARGDLDSSDPLPIRIHSSCVTSEAWGGLDCDCVEQRDAALAAVARAGRGAVFYLDQEGRGAGLVAKARDRMLVQASRERLDTFQAYAELGLPADSRDYHQVASLARLLGVGAPFRLLTNNPDKAGAVARHWEISDTEPLPPVDSPYNAHYLAAKSRSGHVLAVPESTAITAPRDVVAVRPGAEGEPRGFVLAGRYLLPVRRRGGAPVWFRVEVFFDLAEGRVRALLVHDGGDDRAGVVPLVSVHDDFLLHRLPHAHGAGTWADAVEEIAAHGAGVVAFVESSGFDSALRERPGSAVSVAPLIAAVLGERGGTRVRLANGDDTVRDHLDELGASGVPLVAAAS